MIEIERKFLVKGDFLPFVSKKHEIKQGYLCNEIKRTVRVRTKAEKGFITIKGEANENGFSRFEWEKEIPLQEAESLLELCDNNLISKTRHEVVFKGKRFEIDVFYGQNKGLVLAELELEKEDEKFELPNWIGKEVTGDVHYYNAYLFNNPFQTWKNKE